MHTWSLTGLEHVVMYGEWAGVFEAFVDGEAVRPSLDPIAPTVIFNKTDLVYGLHTAIPNVAEGEALTLQ